MPFNLLLETGDNLLIEDGGLLLLEFASSPSLTVLIESTETLPQKIQENTTPMIRAVLIDDLDQQLDPDILLAVLLQVWESDGAVVRPYEDVLPDGYDVSMV